ncbi:MAG: outer membrane beta-barrel domain-containing protein [Desulfuromusa sp.]|nr:outer membrane beta-barrel domain-containing protein [Desulfuromusa sp.]
MLNKIIYLTILLCCISLPVAAENQSGAYSISPMLGSQIFEGNQSLDSSGLWGVGIGYNLTENWTVEGVYTSTDADAEDASTTDTEVKTYRLDALYHFWPDKKLVPYVAAGLGAIGSSPDVGSNRNHLLFNYGGGIKYFILDNLIALRADIRHLLDFPEPYNNLQYSVGLTFQLGKPAHASK